MTELTIDTIDSEIGMILVVSDGESLCALDFDEYEARMLKLLQRRYQHFYFRQKKNPLGLSSRIQAYLEGDFNSVDDLPVSTGGTPFQQQVWTALRTIPSGTVVSYGKLAAKLGKPTASRAVGMTNSLNPVAIVLPCHRVIGATSLTGYAGGLKRKSWLLQHEGVDLTSKVRSKSWVL